MKELTQEQKIKLATEIMGWKIKQPYGEPCILANGKGGDKIRQIMGRKCFTTKGCNAYLELSDWNPTTNAEQFRELEDAYLNKYNVRCITYKYFDLPDNNHVVVAEYWFYEDGFWWFAKGKAETKQQASLNAMLNKVGN